jgi:type IV pilus assembly protein PilZ
MALSFTFEPKDLMELYKAYMPYLKSGGIYIKTEEKVELGDLTSLELTLPNENKPYQFTGPVVWISPQKTLIDGSDAGIGITITGNKAEEIKDKIEILIAEYLISEQPTNTM